MGSQHRFLKFILTKRAFEAVKAGTKQWLIEHASTSEAIGKMALRITSAPSRSVKMYLVGQKLPVIFSIADESRLINEWKQRTKRV